jgi:hypothetical protein
MSRVERTDPKDTDRSRQTLRGRRAAAPQREPNPGRTPSKAEGEVSDVEEALQRQEE